MQAMVLHNTAAAEDDPLSLQDANRPEPGPGQLRVKVRTCGVCQTDLHVVEGDLPEARRPVIPGHQVVGVVDALGDRCRRFAPGDRVGIAWLRGTCGHCRYCQTGRENLCAEKVFTGYHADGGFAEYALVPEDFAYAIPDAFDDVAAAPLLCAGIVGYRALKRSRLGRGGKLAIYGFGSSAHLIAQIALHRGAELYVVTRSEGHQQMARQMGAVWAGEDASRMPGRAEAAILFAPVGKLVPAALKQLAPGGTLAIAGIYLTPMPEMDYRDCVFDERDIRSVTANTRQDGQELLDAAAEAGVTPQTTTYELGEANQALQDIKASAIDGTGVLVIDRGGQ